MDGERFDVLTRRLGATGSRRQLLRGVLGAALGAALGVAGVREAAAACLENGERCGREGDDQCCSGLCKRKRGTNKKFCRQAPGQGTCTIEQNRCTQGDVAAVKCGASGTDCNCYVTAKGTSFCGAAKTSCFACVTNAACEDRPPNPSVPGDSGGQRGDVCVLCIGCGAAGGRGCVQPCANPA